MRYANVMFKNIIEKLKQCYRIYHKPELFLLHKGVPVFRAYNGKNKSEPLNLFFTTDLSEEEEPFDLLEVADKLEEMMKMDQADLLDPDEDQIKRIIALRIDHGIIKPINISSKDILSEEPTNEERACRIDAVMNTYSLKLRGRSYDSDPDDITDLLADVMHYCKRENIIFNEHLRMAKIHFETETAEAK